VRSVWNHRFVLFQSRPHGGGKRRRGARDFVYV
jgi:hypothetical protein